MSGTTNALALTPSDASKILAAKMHYGGLNCKFQMKTYVYDRTSTGEHIIDIAKMWEKVVLAARIMVTVKPQDICVVSSSVIGQRASIKFANFIKQDGVGAEAKNGRFAPGSFTNHSQAGFREPKIILAMDPALDHQAIREASYANIPVIALCDASASLKYVDVAIPCNNKAVHSVGLAFWLLAREILRIRGTQPRNEEWNVMPDLFFYRDPETIKKQEEEELAAAEANNFVQDEDALGDAITEVALDVPMEIPGQQAGAIEDWTNIQQPAVQDWAAQDDAGW